jgi:hypothetical protein
MAGGFYYPEARFLWITRKERGHSGAVGGTASRPFVWEAATRIVAMSS